MTPAQQTRKVDSTLAAILAHPLRCQILTILDTRTASPNEIAKMLGLDVGNVSYHVRRLADDMKVIELVATKPVRGATEHFYRAIERPVASAAESALMTVEQRNNFARLALQLLTADAGTALAAQTFAARPDQFMVRLPGYVDEQGWGALGKIFEEAYQRALDVMAASAARKNANIPMVAGLTFFEMPPAT